MVETLFKYPGVLRRHKEGPLAAEREAYLTQQATQGMARGTILRQSSYCLCIAIELQQWPTDRCFNEDEVEALAAAWAAQRFSCGRASSPRWPKEHFRLVAMSFLQSLGRFCPAESPEPGLYEAELDEFIVSQPENRWQSVATCRSARWQEARIGNVNHLSKKASSHVSCEGGGVPVLEKELAVDKTILERYR